MVGMRAARGTAGGAVNTVEREGGKRGRLTALPRTGAAWLEEASRGGIQGGDARSGDGEVFGRQWWRTTARGGSPTRGSVVGALWLVHVVGGEEVVDDAACDELLGSGAHGGRGGTRDVGVGRSAQIQNGEEEVISGELRVGARLATAEHRVRQRASGAAVAAPIQKGIGESGGCVGVAVG